MAEVNMLNQNETGKENKKNENLIKYRVKNTCWWNEQLWFADDIVELPETAKPPVGDNGHFVKL